MRAPHPARWAVGAWNCSRAAARLADPDTGRDAGAYVLAQVSLRSAPVARTTAFVRTGFANPAAIRSPRHSAPGS